jgi:hypothetical protein
VRVSILIRFLRKRDEDVMQPCQDGGDARFEASRRSEAPERHAVAADRSLVLICLIGHDRPDALAQSGYCTSTDGIVGAVLL